MRVLNFNKKIFRWIQLNTSSTTETEKSFIFVAPYTSKQNGETLKRKWYQDEMKSFYNYLMEDIASSRGKMVTIKDLLLKCKFFYNY